MIRISNISCFRFCWKIEKLDWPECARTLYTDDTLYVINMTDILNHYVVPDIIYLDLYTALDKR